MIKLFIDAWSAHPLRTERNRTPVQLWIEGMLVNARSGSTVTDELYSDTSNYVWDIIILGTPLIQTACRVYNTVHG